MDAAAATIALVDQLDGTQWADADAILDSQHRHLTRVSEYAAAQSPAFSSRLAAAGLRPADLAHPAALAALRPWTRQDLQRAGDDLYCTAPPTHGATFDTRTSGSTGEPVVVRRTGVNALFWSALAMREMRWHGRDLGGRLCSVRANVFSPIDEPSWGLPWTLFGATGPVRRLPVTLDVPVLADAIAAFDPATLVVYPSALGALADHSEAHGIRFTNLRHVLTISETLLPEVRQRAEAVFGVAIADAYTSEEFGHIAVQCPVSGWYHVMAESVLAEVLDDQGHPCAAGEIGRVVLSDLHNYATPLVRYEIGDYAEVAPACPCGRGLPAWRRIAGRRRNLIRLPTGQRHWPRLGFLRAREVAPVRQFQVVQRDLDTVTATLWVERPLCEREEDALRALMIDSLGYPFDVRFSYVSGPIPAGPSGKYEEFVCHVD
jgi:phenylacetate-CoA ligase